MPARHAVSTEVPSHEWPTVHEEHVLRVLPSSPPPLVKSPALQVEHTAARAPLYLLSAPHGLHTPTPKAEAVPARHAVFTAVPSHE